MTDTTVIVLEPESIAIVVEETPAVVVNVAEAVGSPGPPGDDGVDGVDGVDGEDGAPGADGFGLVTYADTSALDAAQTTEMGIVDIPDWRAFFGTNVPEGEGGRVIVETIRNEVPGPTDDITVLQVTTLTWWENRIERRFVRVQSRYDGFWFGWSGWGETPSLNPTIPNATRRTVVINPNSTATSYINMVEDATANTAMYRGSGGRSKVGAPVANDDAATKLYTDTGGWSTVPATPTSAGVAGAKARDASYLYVCTATNTWRRTPLSSW
jgi:hypothetical protein